MEITVSRHGQEGEIAVVRVSGVVDSETVEGFGEALRRVMDEGCYNLVLDIEDLTYINTAGLSIIADTFKRCSQNRGSLKILKATETIRELLDVVRFTKIIDIYEDETEALASFK